MMIRDISFFAGAIFISCVLLFCGLIKKLGINEKQECEMTYSRPNYIKVPWGDASNNSDYKTKYNLFRYEDGSSQNQKFTKKICPVLFIPGHLGSFEQVRSLGSHAAAQKSKGCRLEYYTLDFAEDPSAFSALFLWRQTQAVVQTLDMIQGDIQGRFGSSTKVGKITLVGHSYGGLVARAAAVQARMGLDDSILAPVDAEKRVGAIFTFGTPHLRPVWVHDTSIHEFYDKVTSAWKNTEQDELTFPQSSQQQTHPPAVHSEVSLATLPTEQSALPPETESTPEFTLPNNGTVEVATDADGTQTLMGTLQPETVIHSEDQKTQDRTAQSHITIPIVSICGGLKDFVVNDILCQVEPSVMPGLGWTVYLRDVKGCTLSTGQLPQKQFSADHKALLWCHQPLSTLTSAFSSVLPLLIDDESPPASEILQQIKQKMTAPSKAKANENAKDQNSQSFVPEEDLIGLAGLSLILETMNGNALMCPIWTAVALALLAWSILVYPTYDAEDNFGGWKVSAGEFPPVLRALLPQHHLGLKYFTKQMIGLKRKTTTLIFCVILLIAFPFLAEDAIAAKLSAMNGLPKFFVSVFSGMCFLLKSPVLLLVEWEDYVATHLHQSNPLLPQPAPLGLALLYCLTIFLMGCALLAGKAFSYFVGWLLGLSVITSPATKVMRFWRHSKRWLNRGRKNPPQPQQSSMSSFFWQAVGVLMLVPFHIRSIKPLKFQLPSILVEVALIQVSCLVALLLGILGLCYSPNLKKKETKGCELGSLRWFLLLLYLPLLPLYAGCFLSSSRIFWTGDCSNFPGKVRQIFTMLFDCFLLAPTLLVLKEAVILKQGYRLSIKSLGELNELLYCTGVIAKSEAVSHANCKKCLHEDGGPRAVFVETRLTSPVVQQVAPGVLVGPTFRVISCLCPRFLRDPREWCNFCACRCNSCDASVVSRANGIFQQNEADKNALIFEDVGFSIIFLVLSTILCLVQPHSINCKYFITTASFLVNYAQTSRRK